MQVGILKLIRIVGVLRTKIVGVQYYKGYATEGEYVIIRRESSNPVCAPRNLSNFVPDAEIFFSLRNIV